MNILLINQYAGNKGDRAVLYAMCVMLIRRYPDCQIIVSTSSPELWEGYSYYEDHHIKFIPSAWNYSNITQPSIYWRFLNKFKKYTFTILRESALKGFKLYRFLANPSFYNAAKWADGIISVGGHHFTTILSRDLVSNINFDAAIAVNINNLICFSQSFGPFEFHNNRNQVFTKSILNKCLLLSPRENSSVKELEKLQLKDPEIHQTYESVISLNKLFTTYTPIENRPKKIGIAIYCTQYRNSADMQQYIETFSEFSNFIIKYGYKVVFFPMELKGSVPDDRPVIHKIINEITQKEEVELIDEDLTTLEHLNQVAKCRLFVGHKTHSTIFALTTGTPLIGIAYHPKTIEFMKLYDLEKYAIDDKKLSTQILIDKFLELENKLSQVGLHCNNLSQDYASKIEQDFVYAISLLKKNI